MAHVLSNLLNNAAKYTDAGGTICLDIRLEDTRRVFGVADNGIGMSIATLQKVFRMFAQEQAALDRSEGGLGIELALSKGLVELRDCEITASSAGAGLGSRFEICVPFHQETSGQHVKDKNAESRILTTTTITVLIADDNRDSAETLAELLRLEGHTVVTVPDGLQAVALAIELKPAVMVLDIRMPGLNGYEVAQRIRLQPEGDFPLLVAATGWGQDEDRLKAHQAGFDLHLTKPFDPQKLIDVIATRAMLLESSRRKPYRRHDFN
nr:response regulator [Polaromonas sp. CG_9.11]